MVKASASTVSEYLKGLPNEQRETLSAVLDTVRKHMPDGYQESIGFGMIWYSIPLERYPKTYNKQPLGYVALAAQKNYCTLYLMSAYGYPPHLQELKEGFKAAGKKLDMGKSCIHFQKPDDLELGVIAKIIASTPPEKWIEMYESSRAK